MAFQTTDIPGLLIINPPVFEDSRGYFFEAYNQFLFEKNGITSAFDYIAYCTGPETALALLNDFKEESPRKTVWTEPEVLEEQPYLATVVESYDVGRPFTPGLAQWLELFIGLAEGLSAAMSEQKAPQDALNDVAAAWTTVIAQAPPDWEYKE